MEIAVLLFDRITALDAIGPCEVLGRLPGARLRFVGHQPGPVTADNGGLQLSVQASIDDVPQPDIVLVPGGYGTRALESDTAVLQWLRHAHAHSTWTTSVCTGSVVLAAAGLLEGLPATTHWSQRDALASHGAEPVAQRVVESGKIVTAAGVSAGIDMALHLAARIAGDAIAQAIQLGIEYDPQPPFDAGSVDKAPPAVVELVRARMKQAQVGD
ncbi:MAG: DJ-1/PfpI family protein [Deltaproteobacteria bacterium]|nr:DJ-1/PfpI family protein [Deltaproteobacteria bacterium]